MCENCGCKVVEVKEVKPVELIDTVIETVVQNCDCGCDDECACDCDC